MRKTKKEPRTQVRIVTRETSAAEPRPPAKKKAVLQGFEEIWSRLFTSPIHLDSALSKQTPAIKSILAQILPVILLRPASTAEILGVGLAPGEPWSLDSKQLENWRPAHLMAERLYENMSQPNWKISSIEGDFPGSMVSEWNAEWNESVVQDLVSTLGRSLH